VHKNGPTSDAGKSRVLPEDRGSIGAGPPLPKTTERDWTDHRELPAPVNATTNHLLSRDGSAYN